MPKLRDLTGQRFGKLIAIKYIGNRKWQCACDCGNNVVVYSFNLTKGLTTSCGCIVRNRGDITGQRFGKLTVIKRVYKGSNVKNAYYLCKCDCGNETEVNRSALITGKTTSCGCIGYDLFMNDIRYRAGFSEGTCASILKSKLSIKNTSGIKGVTWDRDRGKWTAQIYFKGKRYFLGRYDDKNDARKAREMAEEKLFGKFLEWYEKEYKNK